MSKFPYKWYLKDGYPAKGIEPNGLKVFGTFVCGGGSTMGYKLAGFTHLGGVEIDKEVATVYKENHKPKYLFNEDIRDFNKRTDLPSELFNLDLLDGSPPCSTFSMAGSREKAWGKEKQFREGQTVQTLDDLVFVYCNTIIKLQPKVFLLENVKGIIQGNAKLYSKKIVEKMTKAGYFVQVFCLNAASMGVPQKRERVFFIGYRKDLNFPKLKLEFNESIITLGHCLKEFEGIYKESLTANQKNLWQLCKEGETFGKYTPKGSSFGQHKVNSKDACVTLSTKSDCCFHYSEKRQLQDDEVKIIGTYPMDYVFKYLQPKYLIGMSVPPVMTAQIANQIYLQWFKNKAKIQPI